MNMLKSAWNAVVRFFAGLAYRPNANSLTDEVVETADTPNKTQKTTPSTIKNKMGGQANDIASMGDLLGRIDEMFNLLRLPFEKMSWIDKSYVVGLRRMGIHVAHPAYDDIDPYTETVPAGRILPAMMCVSFGLSRRDDNNSIFPACVFGIKQNKLPAEVSRCKGQHYVFGCGFRIRSENHNQGRLFWVAGYITVRSDGSLYLHQEIKPRRHTIKTSSPSARRAFGRTITYTSKSWGKASLAELFDDCGNCDGDLWNGKRACITSFAVAMHWWIKRENMWSVAVRKDGERVTFAVPKQVTAKFFKDRIKVTNSNGVTRRIIHYVKSHERVTKDVKTEVREHIRGLSEFEWKGYMCKVTAPKFNGRLSTEFTLEAKYFEDDNQVVNDRYVDISKVGGMLADGEECRRASR